MELVLAIVAGVALRTRLVPDAPAPPGTVDRRPEPAGERIERPDLHRRGRDARPATADHRGRRASAAASFADPVPQSLILTAIVIGFGVLAFSLVLAHRVHASAGSDDIDAIRLDRRTDAARPADPRAAGDGDRAAAAAAPAHDCCAAVAFAGALAILAPPSRCCSRASKPAGIQVLADRVVAGAVRHHAGRRPVQRAAGGDGRASSAPRSPDHSFSGVDPRREALGYHALIHVLLMGVSGAFLTGDIFNLYVWFEVMLIASFVLMSLHRTRAQLHAAFIYVALNLLASAFLLTAIGLLYGQAGTLNLADLARAWPERRTPALDAALSMLFLTAFGIKAGLFPLFFWLPASYHTPPAAIGALFAGLLTKVGVYAMIRVFTLLFPRCRQRHVHGPARAVGGDDGRGSDRRVGQRDFRRVLSFNLVGHIGFTTVGLALWTPLALAASILYMLHHMLVITNLFLVSGLFLRQRRTTNCRHSAGCIRTHPAVALLAMIPVFSLAGRAAAVGIHRASLASSRPRSSAAALLAGRYRPRRQPADAAVDGPRSGMRRSGSRLRRSLPLARRSDSAMLAPIAFLALLTLGLSVAAEPVFNVSRRAAEQLLHADEYVRRRAGRTITVLLGNLLLALAWAALQGEFSLAHLLATGYVLGYLVLLVLVKGGVLGRSSYIGKVHLAVGLAAFFLWELVRANLRLAFDVATPRFQMKPGILAVPLDATRDSEILLLAMLINLTPGSVALDVSDDRKVMYVHVMYIEQSRSRSRRDQAGFERRVLQLLAEGSRVACRTCTIGIALAMLTVAALLDLRQAPARTDAARSRRRHRSDRCPDRRCRSSSAPPPRASRLSSTWHRHRADQLRWHGRVRAICRKGGNAMIAWLPGSLVRRRRDPRPARGDRRPSHA